jgi:hypothetical protein
MNRENNSFGKLSQSQDEIQIQVGCLVIAVVASKSSSSNVAVPKTARDKFFRDLQYRKENKRCSTASVTMLENKINLYEKFVNMKNVCYHFILKKCYTNF